MFAFPAPVIATPSPIIPSSTSTPNQQQQQPTTSVTVLSQHHPHTQNSSSTPSSSSIAAPTTSGNGAALTKHNMVIAEKYLTSVTDRIQEDRHQNAAAGNPTEATSFSDEDLKYFLKALQNADTLMTPLKQYLKRLENQKAMVQSAVARILLRRGKRKATYKSFVFTLNPQKPRMVMNDKAVIEFVRELFPHDETRQQEALKKFSDMCHETHVNKQQENVDKDQEEKNFSKRVFKDEYGTKEGSTAVVAADVSSILEDGQDDYDNNNNTSPTAGNNNNKRKRSNRNDGDEQQQPKRKRAAVSVVGASRLTQDPDDDGIRLDSSGSDTESVTSSSSQRRPRKVRRTTTTSSSSSSSSIRALPSQLSMPRSSQVIGGAITDITADDMTNMMQDMPEYMHMLPRQ
jgi:hypothetical protein